MIGQTRNEQSAFHTEKYLLPSLQRKQPDFNMGVRKHARARYQTRHQMIDMEEFERRLRRRSSGNQTDDDPLAELARLTSGQQDSFQRVVEPQGQSSTEARQVATSSPEAKEDRGPESQDALQSLQTTRKMACPGLRHC